MPERHALRPTTGTSVYTLLECRRAVALDLAGDRSLRRETLPEEAVALQRGRDLEAEFVDALGWPEPEYQPRTDWAAGAAATEAMLAEGIPGVSQGILLSQNAERLGIPDLLRREDGDGDTGSRFGAFHYVVGDIKSSAAPRSNQVLQVAFYSRMLAELQGYEPEYGYLVLKDGREERFRLADFRPALDQVESEIDGIRADPDAVRPFYGISCRGCRWSEVCLPELRERDDLSRLAGMTRAMRGMLEGAGVANSAAMATASIDKVVAKTGVEAAYLRRLQRSAVAKQDGEPIREGVAKSLPPGVFVHVLRDAFAERVLWVGALVDAGKSSSRVVERWPESRDAEWAAFLDLLREAAPKGSTLYHYGRTLPAWFDEHAHEKSSSLEIESRFVDIGQRLRGAAIYPGPVFGLADHVRYSTDQDPERAGRTNEAAWRVHSELAEASSRWLSAKGTADLEDLAQLAATMLQAQRSEGAGSA